MKQIKTNKLQELKNSVNSPKNRSKIIQEIETIENREKFNSNPVENRENLKTKNFIANKNNKKQELI